MFPPDQEKLLLLINVLQILDLHMRFDVGKFQLRLTNTAVSSSISKIPTF